LLPLALTFPWIYRKLERWLDRAWWGRRFGPVEAVKYFLAGIQHSTTEDQLVRRAQDRLTAIFQADTQIVVAGESTSPSFESVIDVPIRVSGESTGTLRVGPRLEATPYFNKDATLLATLADVFAYMLENIRLQQKKQDQETRERELTIHASRSELKALRAQINPHFLFNALNAIAGLVHKNPSRAEETVEQLSEGYYGDGAKLEVVRNDSSGRTIASVVLPISSTPQQKHGSS
jgi:LytS/YehU family sensor histidine kinase